MRTIGWGTVAAVSPLAMCADPALRTRKPNIILILADDMGWSDPGCYGGEIDTPNLDLIAGRGIRFTQFHNTSKCFPSRACLLTGLYAQQCGMDTQPGSIRGAVTLGEVMRSAGYRTLMVGKHHGTDNPFDRGFDHYYGMRDGAANYFNPGIQRPGEGVPAQKRPGQRIWCFDDNVVQPYTPVERDFYTTDYYTKWALEFLDRYREEERPFFLYLSYTAPHDPLQAWQADIDKYRGRFLAGYDSIRHARYDRQKAVTLIDDTFPLSPPTYQDWANLTEEEKRDQDLRMAVYAAMIDRLDQNIGKLLAKIRELGEEENTLILFASDNGCSAEVVRLGSGEIGTMTRWASLGRDWANVSNTPFRFYKNYSFEGGICTPLIACWPGASLKGGQVSHRMAHFIDFMPTLVEIAGAEYPTEHNGRAIPPMEGESFLPVLKGNEKARHRPLFWQWGQGKAVVKDGWKLVSHAREPGELYDIVEDKTETVNVAEEHPETVAELDTLWEAWYRRCKIPVTPE